MANSDVVILCYRRSDNDQCQTEIIAKQYVNASFLSALFGIKSDTITLIHTNTDEAIVIADIVTDANQPLPLASDGPYEVIGVSLSDVAPTMPIPEISDLSIKNNRLVTLRYRKNATEPYKTIEIANSDITASSIALRFGIDAQSVTLFHHESDEAVVASEFDDPHKSLPLATDGPYEVVGTVIHHDDRINPMVLADDQSMAPPSMYHEFIDDAVVISADDPDLASVACHQALMRIEQQQTNHVSREILKQIRKQLDLIDQANYKKVNLALVGITGSGKSTLINQLCGSHLADEGVGPPLTTEITEYPRDHDHIEHRAFRHLRLFDTRGIERGAQVTNETVGIVENFLRNRNNNPDMKEHIHFVLYTILATGNRFEEIDRRLIAMIDALGIGVIIVITQAYGDEGQLNKLIDHISNECPNIEIIPVLAREVKPMGGGTIVAPYGLDTLAAMIMHKLPDQCQAAFAAAQAVDVRLKVERAKSLVFKMMAVGAGLGAMPGTLLTMPVFIAGISEKIANVFDMSFKDTFKDLVGNTKMIGMMLTSVGMMAPIVFEESVNWIPIFGAVIGGLVGMAAVKLYCDKLIGCLEQIYRKRNGDMAGLDPTEVLRSMIG